MYFRRATPFITMRRFTYRRLLRTSHVDDNASSSNPFQNANTTSGRNWHMVLSPLRAHAKEFKRRSDFLCVHALLCFFHVSHIFPVSTKTPQTREFSFRRQMPDAINTMDERKRNGFSSSHCSNAWNEIYFSFGNADAFQSWSDRGVQYGARTTMASLLPRTREMYRCALDICRSCLHFFFFGCSLTLHVRTKYLPLKLIINTVSEIYDAAIRQPMFVCSNGAGSNSLGL